MLASIGCVLGIVFLGIFIAFFMWVFGAGSNVGGSISEEVLFEGTDGKIAVIAIDGVITGGSSDSGVLTAAGTTSDRVNKELSKAVNDPSVDGILLKMNTPGGEVVASDLILDKVLEAKEEKPVVTWMSGMGASGGYLIAAGTDHIAAHPGAMTGSIGVILEVTNLEGLYEKLGIDSRIFKSGEFKDQSGVFDDDPDGEADQIIQGIVDEAYEDFLQVIVENREMDEGTIRKLADGRIYTGLQAEENGLIDSTGNMDDAIDELETLIGKTGLSVVEYSEGGFWSSFYEYEQIFLDRLGLLQINDGVGMNVYYLLDV